MTTVWAPGGEPAPAPPPASSSRTSLRGSRGSPNFSVVSWMIGTTGGSVVAASAPALPRRENSSPNPTSAIPPAAPSGRRRVRSSGGACTVAVAAAIAVVARPSTRTGSPSGASLRRAAPSRYGLRSDRHLRRRHGLAPRRLHHVRLDAGTVGGSAGGQRGIADDQAHQREVRPERLPPVLVVEEIDDRRAVDVRGQRGVQRGDLRRALRLAFDRAQLFLSRATRPGPRPRASSPRRALSRPSQSAARADRRRQPRRLRWYRRVA